MSRLWREGSVLWRESLFFRASLVVLLVGCARYLL